jgi:hypothetical protein
MGWTGCTSGGVNGADWAGMRRGARSLVGLARMGDLFVIRPRYEQLILAIGRLLYYFLETVARTLETGTSGLPCFGAFPFDAVLPSGLQFCTTKSIHLHRSKCQ